MSETDKPQEDPNIRGDAFKTLIVARLSYDATEQDLESEFGRFGPIERVCLMLSLLTACANILIDPNCSRRPTKPTQEEEEAPWICLRRVRTGERYER